MVRFSNKISLPMTSTISERMWKTRFAELMRFSLNFGHCRVPFNWPENPALAKWVVIQRNRQWQLPLNRLRRLYNMGFPFGRWERQWLHYFFKFIDWHSSAGNKVPPAFWPKDKSLRSWMHLQRKRKRQGTLPLERVRRLTQVGFVWNPQQASWDSKIAELRRIYQRYGHCNFRLLRGQHSSLITWTHAIRRRRNRLTTSRVRQLNNCGFVWLPDVELWEETFAALVRFKRRFGHCDVPQSWPDHRLALWVGFQRSNRARLSPNHKRRLKKIGFTFRYQTVAWERKFRELVEFQKRYGHCKVPHLWKQNWPLGRWVGNQRRKREAGDLDREKICRLDSLGFDWIPFETSWKQHIEELKTFKQRFGHCRVTATRPGYKSLAFWLRNARQDRDHLPAHRKKMLADLGAV
jgi:helicase associated protein